ncbi:MAG: T9SS type A sorting domain-containing protein [Bacteroidota bacterium]
MKQLLLFACLSLFTFGLNAQVFVDIDAADGGDGTSWATAYNDLNVALLSAPAGSSVWIAEGTYVTPDSVSFFIDKELTVLGGFSGVETEASAADPTKFESILSGDVLGNDPVGSYDSLLYMDNQRVLFITDTNDVSAYTVTLDGLTITNGGRAIDFQDGSLLAFSGAGIRSYAKLAASRLKFTANRASFGSAISTLFSTANGSTYDAISLEGNFSGDNRQIYARLIDTISFTNSSFEGLGDTEMTSGIFQFIDVNDISIENSSFKNITTTFSGSAIRAIDSDDILVRKCTFDTIVGSAGSGFFNFISDGYTTTRTRDLNDAIIDSCMFNFCNVSGTGRGGAWRVDDTNVTFKDTKVNDCSTPGGIGGSAYVQHSLNAETYSILIEGGEITEGSDQGAGGAICALMFSGTKLDITFDGVMAADNESNADGRGAVLYLQGDSSVLNIWNSTFADNIAVGRGTGGGFEINGDFVELDIANSTFTGNEGSFGATFISRGNNNHVIRTSTFDGNGGMSTYQGGAFAIYQEGDGTNGIVIDSCTFANNSVTEDPNNILSGGAGMYLLGQDVVAKPLSITNSTFTTNATNEGTSAGGVYIVGAFDASVDNNVFDSNTADGDGGAIATSNAVERRDTVNDVITVVFPEFDLSMSGNLFYANFAQNQGGAISTQGSVSDLINNSFVQNSVANNGGGAIIFNGNAPNFSTTGVQSEAGEKQLTANVIHNTFIDNEKGASDVAVGDHIAFFQPGETVLMEDNSMTIQLLNNAFVSTLSDGDLLEIEPGTGELADGTPLVGYVPVGDLTVISLGGNLFDGNALDAGLDLMNADDITTVSIEDEDALATLFVDAFADNGDLPDLNLFVPADLTENPMISGGVTNDLVPATGQGGNPRGDAPDIGSFEADQAATSVRPVEESGLKMSFYPNPTADVMIIENNDASITRFQVIVADQAGRILAGKQFTGTNSRLDLTGVPSGIYNLQLLINGNVYSKQIVKQ